MSYQSILIDVTQYTVHRRRKTYLNRHRHPYHCFILCRIFKFLFFIQFFHFQVLILYQSKYSTILDFIFHSGRRRRPGYRAIQSRVRPSCYDHHTPLLSRGKFLDPPPVWPSTFSGGNGGTRVFVSTRRREVTLKIFTVRPFSTKSIFASYFAQTRGHRIRLHSQSRTGISRFRRPFDSVLHVHCTRSRRGRHDFRHNFNRVAFVLDAERSERSVGFTTMFRLCNEYGSSH